MRFETQIKIIYIKINGKICELLTILSLIFLICLIFSALLIVEIIVNRFTQNERVKLVIVTISCLLSTIILGIGIIFALREK